MLLMQFLFASVKPFWKWAQIPEHTCTLHQSSPKSEEWLKNTNKYLLDSKNWISFSYKCFSDTWRTVVYRSFLRKELKCNTSLSPRIYYFQMDNDRKQNDSKQIKFLKVLIFSTSPLSNNALSLLSKVQNLLSPVIRNFKLKGEICLFFYVCEMIETISLKSYGSTT